MVLHKYCIVVILWNILKKKIKQNLLVCGAQRRARPLPPRDQESTLRPF